LAFIVIEGFSGTGKTTLAKRLERHGWLRLTESAHAVPRQVPVADRADTFSDFSLIGATLQYCSIISMNRTSRNIVSEGYLLGDLAYARIRYDLGKSIAFPALLALVKRVLAEKSMRPDLYVLLRARAETIGERQLGKASREKNISEFFRQRYYSAIMEMHQRLGQDNLEVVSSEGGGNQTLQAILSLVKERGISDRMKTGRSL
jgi:thymidylate kinase